MAGDRRDIFRLLGDSCRVGIYIDVLVLLLVIPTRGERTYNNPPYETEILVTNCQPFDPNQHNPEKWHARVRTLSEPGNSLYGYVKVTNESAYEGPLNCGIKIIAPTNYTFTVRIPEIEIYQDDTQCQHDYMSITGATNALHYCGFGTIGHSIYSTSNWLIFSIHVSNWTHSHGYHGFTLYYTALHSEPCNTHPNISEWYCKKNSQCTPAEVICDNNDNCGQWEDEKSKACGLTTGSVIAISIVCILVGGGIILFVVWCIYDKKKIKRRQEQRRQEMATVRYRAPCVEAGIPGGPPVSSSLTEPPPPYTPWEQDNLGLNVSDENHTVSNQGSSTQVQSNGMPPATDVTPRSLNVRLMTASAMRPSFGEPPPLYTPEDVNKHTAEATNQDTATVAEATNQDTTTVAEATNQDTTTVAEATNQDMATNVSASLDNLPEKSDEK